MTFQPNCSYITKFFMLIRLMCFKKWCTGSQETKCTYAYVVCLSQKVNEERRFLSQMEIKSSLGISWPITLISYFNENIYFLFFILLKLSSLLLFILNLNMQVTVSLIM